MIENFSTEPKPLSGPKVVAIYPPGGGITLNTDRPNVDYVRAFGLVGSTDILFLSSMLNRHLNTTKAEYDEIITHLMKYRTGMGLRTSTSMFDYAHSDGLLHSVTITRKHQQGSIMTDNQTDTPMAINSNTQQLGVKIHEGALTMAKDALCAIDGYDAAKSPNCFEYSYTPQSTYGELLKAIHDHFNLSDQLIKPSCADDPIYMYGFSHVDINTLVQLVSTDLYDCGWKRTLPGAYRKVTTGYNTLSGRHSVEITMDKGYRTDTIEIKITFSKITQVN